MLTLQDNLNLRIGTNTWKKYISAAFWNYISTPINFTITLFTAFSAGQTGTDTLYLTKDQLFYILMTSFLLSVINTFFKLKEKAVLNYNACNHYNKFGSEFEDIYFTPITCDADVIKRLNAYKELQRKINKYNEEENVENVNYITNLLYYSINYLFIHRMKRINKDERFWLLDGKPNNPFYPRNRYNVETSKYFKEDFNYADDVNPINNAYHRFRYRNPNLQYSEGWLGYFHSGITTNNASTNTDSTLCISDLPPVENNTQTPTSIHISVCDKENDIATTPICDTPPQQMGDGGDRGDNGTKGTKEVRRQDLYKGGFIENYYLRKMKEAEQKNNNDYREGYCGGNMQRDEDIARNYVVAANDVESQNSKDYRAACCVKRDDDDEKVSPTIKEAADNLVSNGGSGFFGWI